MRVRWTTDAVDDLERICDCIATSRPGAAQNVAATIVRRIADLETSTVGTSGPRQRNARVDLRIAVVCRLYEVHPEEVHVLRILHGAWWWNGIPTASPSALLIGAPYTGLWSEFVSAARSSPTGLHYLEDFVQTAAGDAGNRIPSPPSSISQPPEPARQTVFDPSKPEDMAAMFQPHETPYPDVWPFEGPVS